MVVRVPTATPAPGRRRLIIIVVAVVAALLVAFTALSGFFVDVLWFREVNLSDVFWTVLRTKVLLGLAFGLTFFVLLFSNLWIVRRITPRFHALTPEQEIIERYRMQFEPYIRWLLPLFALVIAVFVGLGVTTQWQTYLLWRNGSGLSFGNPEPLFGRDPAFYVFTLPWLKFMQGWLFSALVGVTFLTALAHYLWGGIRPQAPGFVDKVTPQVKAHMSVLLGLIMLTKAWGYYLGQFDLLDLHPRGRGRRLLHGRERAAARAPDPGGDRDRLRDPVPGQHPAPRMGAARHRGRSARARLDHRGSGVPGVRATVPRHAAGVPAGTAVHRGQHRGDADAPSQLDGIQSSSRPIGESVTQRGRARERRDDLEHPPVAPRRPARQLHLAAAVPLVLRVQRRRRRSLRHRRASAAS